MLSRRKKLLFYSIYLPLVLIFFFSVAEILSRWAGYEPWFVRTENTKVEPGGRLFEKDAKLGYRDLPGQYKVTLKGAYVYTVTNLEDASRATHPLETYGNRGQKPEIWIFGDSVTYGWSVNDQDTFAWLLQEDFPDYEVVNFAVSGYGTLHSMIQLRDLLQHRKAPRLVILPYASWLDFRTTPNRRRKKMYVGLMGQMSHPSARLTETGKLEIFEDSLQYREFPLVRYSAFMNLLDEIYTKNEEKSFDSSGVTRATLNEIAGLCRSHGSDLIIGTLTSNPATNEMRTYCQQIGVKTVDMFVELGLKGNNNLPYDIHPSPFAHRQYEQKLKPVVQEALSKELSK